DRAVRLVLEYLHRAAVGLGADDAGEDNDSARAGIVHARRDFVGGQRPLDDGEDISGTIVDHSTARRGRPTQARLALDTLRLALPFGLRLARWSIISPLPSALGPPAARTTPTHRRGQAHPAASAETRGRARRSGTPRR